MQDSEKDEPTSLAVEENIDAENDGVRRYSRSLSDYVIPKFERLCRAAGFDGEAETSANILADLMEPWGSEMRGLDPEWHSEISDDNTPVEFSVTLGDGDEEVRALLEAQSSQPTLHAHRAAALMLTDRLELTYGADLSRFRKVQDLFLPEDMLGPFALWHSVVFRRGHAPSFKAYLNPAAQGPARAPQLVEEALHRLGLDRAWSSLCQSAVTRGPFLDEVKYFALDLSEGPEARVKIYVRHHEATAFDLEATCQAADSYRPGEAYSFVRAMAGGEMPMRQRAPFTCSSFIGGRDARPVATTLYVPVCAYASNDAVVRDRVVSHLGQGSALASRYEELLEGFADRSLDAGVGLQSWAAHRRYNQAGRYTVYLSTEASRVFPPDEVPAPTIERTQFRSAHQAVQTALDYRVSEHPFFCRVVSNGSEVTACCLAALGELGCALRSGVVESPTVAAGGSGQLEQQLISMVTARFGGTHALVCTNVDRQVALGEELRGHLTGTEGGRLGATLVVRVATVQIVAALADLLESEKKDAGESIKKELDRCAGEVEHDLAVLNTLGRAATPAVRQGALGAQRALWGWLDSLYLDVVQEPLPQAVSGTHPVHDGQREKEKKGKSNA